MTPFGRQGAAALQEASGLGVGCRRFANRTARWVTLEPGGAEGLHTLEGKTVSFGEVVNAIKKIRQGPAGVAQWLNVDL